MNSLHTGFQRMIPRRRLTLAPPIKRRFPIFPAVSSREGWETSRLCYPNRGSPMDATQDQSTGAAWVVFFRQRYTRRLLRRITSRERTIGIEKICGDIDTSPPAQRKQAETRFTFARISAELDPTPPPLLPQPKQNKRIRPKKHVSTLQNKELTTKASGALLAASSFATWLMICWIRTTLTCILRAMSGRNSVMALSVGAWACLAAVLTIAAPSAIG